MFIGPITQDWSGQYINDVSQGESASQVSWPENLSTSAPGWWKDITGMSNTEAQNYMAWQLQQDSQAFNAAQEAMNRKFNADQAQIARDWQERMSNTAYQRSVADIQASGLNPWLAVSNGASSGSAVAASSSGASSGIGSAQASNVNALASIGTAAAGIGILIKAIHALSK